MKKFLRIIIAIMILFFGILWSVILSMAIISAIPLGWLFEGNREVSFLIGCVGDVWLSLYRCVRL
jgi:hypothetical protein